MVELYRTKISSLGSTGEEFLDQLAVFDQFDRAGVGGVVFFSRVNAQHLTEVDERVLHADRPVA